MKGLLLLAPFLSCAFALVTYLADGDFWMILAAFFVAGPLCILVLGLVLGRPSDDSGDPK
ncbi:MAG: hypothetical protein QNI90_01965 [Dinoroseobacter sp.]|nr:hypothetical protein [Dinoroseobacter sp.]